MTQPPKDIKGVTKMLYQTPSSASRKRLLCRFQEMYCALSLILVREALFFALETYTPAFIFFLSRKSTAQNVFGYTTAS